MNKAEEKAKEKIKDVLLTNGVNGTTINRILAQLEKVIRERTKEIFDEIERFDDSLSKRLYQSDRWQQLRKQFGYKK